MLLFIASMFLLRLYLGAAAEAALARVEEFDCLLVEYFYGN